MKKPNEKQQMQEVFDRVAIHLLMQGKRSKDRNGTWCAYRGPDGTACAVGCLIDDKHYQKRFEGVAINNPVLGPLMMQSVEVSLGMSLGDKEKHLLFALQIVHDNEQTPAWGYHLSRVADSFNLEKDFLNFALAYTKKVTE